VLRKNELYAKLKKCEFWLGQVAFFMYVVSNKGVSVDPQKIKSITKWPRSKNSVKVRSLLRLVGYYHWFVQNFSKIAISLTNLTRKVTK